MIHLTRKTIASLATLLLAAMTVTSAIADEKPPLLDRSKFSIGAGISNNSLSGPFNDETGFQFFGAYNLTAINLMEGVNTSVEVGYMDYGFDGADTNGLWSTAVVDGSIGKNFGWLARLGLDFGDDSGLMAGGGISYGINKKFELRGEYVVRDQIDSLQFNAVYRL